MNFTTTILSSTSSVGIIEPDGILYSSKTKTFIANAKRKATTMISTSSLNHDLFFLRYSFFTILFPLEFEHCHKRFLRYLDLSELFHAFLAFFLFLPELTFSRYVPAVTLGGDVFADRPDRLTRDYLASYRGLKRYLEKLPRDKLFQFRDELVALIVRAFLMDDKREGVAWLSVNKYVKFHEVARHVFLEFVIERAVAPRH